MSTVIVNPETFVARLILRTAFPDPEQDRRILAWRKRRRDAHRTDSMCNGCLHGEHCGRCRCVCKELRA